MRALLIMTLLLFSACASTPVLQSEPAERFVYRLGAGDRLKIVTYGEEQLSGEFPVTGEGIVAFPLVGDVKAAGLTIGDFRRELSTRLGAGYVRNPLLTVEVTNYRPVYILGEVARPGEFAFTERLTVYALVAKAGGFTYRANQKIAFIRREDDVAEKPYALTSGTAIHPGDTVRIGLRYF